MAMFSLAAALSCGSAARTSGGGKPPRPGMNPRPASLAEAGSAMLRARAGRVRLRRSPPATRVGSGPGAKAKARERWSRIVELNGEV